MNNNYQTPKKKKELLEVRKKNFSMKIYLHKSFSLRILLFNLVLHVLTRDVQKIILKIITFEDYKVLVEKLRENFNSKIQLWRHIVIKGFFP